MAAPGRGRGKAEGPQSGSQRVYELSETGGRLEDCRRDSQEAGKAEVGGKTPAHQETAPDPEGTPVATPAARDLLPSKVEPDSPDYRPRCGGAVLPPDCAQGPRP